MRPGETKIAIQGMSPMERCERAVDVVNGINNKLMEAIGLNQTNKIVVFSSTLAGQIPESYAANAFNLFQESMFRTEVISLCSIWDPPDLDKQNMPLLISLICEAKVLRQLRAQHMEDALEKPLWILNENQLDENARQHLGKWFEQNRVSRAEQDFRRNRKEFFGKARWLCRSGLVEKVRNLRHAYSHNFEAGINVPTKSKNPVQYKDVGDLLTSTVEIAHAANCLVRYADVDFEGAEMIWKEHAEALWHNCTFSNVV